MDPLFRKYFPALVLVLVAIAAFFQASGANELVGAAFVAATDGFLRARNKKFSGSISLLITGDEEGPARNGTRRVLQWLEG